MKERIAELEAEVSRLRDELEKAKRRYEFAEKAKMQLENSLSRELTWEKTIRDQESFVAELRAELEKVKDYASGVEITNNALIDQRAHLQAQLLRKERETVEKIAEAFDLIEIDDIHQQWHPGEIAVFIREWNRRKGEDKNEQNNNKFK